MRSSWIYYKGHEFLRKGGFGTLNNEMNYANWHYGVSVVFSKEISFQPLRAKLFNNSGRKVCFCWVLTYLLVFSWISLGSYLLLRDWGVWLFTFLYVILVLYPLYIHSFGSSTFQIKTIKNWTFWMLTTFKSYSFLDESVPYNYFSIMIFFFIILKILTDATIWCPIFRNLYLMNTKKFSIIILMVTMV